MASARSSFNTACKAQGFPDAVVVGVEYINTQIRVHEMTTKSKYPTTIHLSFDCLIDHGMLRGLGPLMQAVKAGDYLAVSAPPHSLLRALAYAQLIRTFSTGSTGYYPSKELEPMTTNKGSSADKWPHLWWRQAQLRSRRRLQCRHGLYVFVLYRRVYAFTGVRKSAHIQTSPLESGKRALKVSGKRTSEDFLPAEASHNATTADT